MENAWRWRLVIAAALAIGYFTAQFALLQLPQAEAAYTIGNSARFNDDDSAYLTRTPSSGGNRQKFTLSVWFKRGNLSTAQYIFQAGADNNNRTIVGEFRSAGSVDAIRVAQVDAGVVTLLEDTCGVFRDPAAWQHLVVAVDTTQAAGADRVRVYVDGIQHDPCTSETTITQNTNTYVNHTVAQYVGTNLGTGSFYDGYMADVHFIDGQALTPSDFGEYDDNGYWRPKSYTGTYGTNGFKFNFGNGSELGDDVSGNANDWTATNMDATDQVIDTPTNSFATWNYLVQSGISQGNLRAVTIGSYSTTGFLHLTDIPVESGSFYCEVTQVSETDAVTAVVGVYAPSAAVYTQAGSEPYRVAYRSDGQKDVVGTASAYGASWDPGDIIGVALNASTNAVEFYKNGSAQGSIDIPFSGPYVLLVHDHTGSQTATLDLNCGQGGQSGLTYDSASGGYFEYTPPSGFKALSTSNLPEPDVAVPKNYFDAVTYTGTGAPLNVLQTGTSTNGTGFIPDLVWLKGRATSTSHGLFDSIRGVVQRLAPEVNTAETTETESLTGLVPLGYVSQLTNPGGNNELDNARGVFVVGNYAYVTNETRDSLAVIDVSDPANPTFVTEVRNPNGSNELDGARGIYVSGNYAYVATVTRDSLAIIDISNPLSPSFVTEVISPNGSNELDGATGVYVSGNYAYVAAATRDSLVILDISNPASPSYVSEVRSPGGNNELDGAFSVFVQGNYAYVANLTRDSLVVIDVSTPASPSFLAEVRDPGGQNELNGAAVVSVQGNYAYVSANTRDSLVVIDISTPASPSYVTELRTGSGGLLNAIHGLYVSGSYAYATAEARDSLAIIDISTPTSPKFVTEVRPGGTDGLLNGARGVFALGDYVYVTTGAGDAFTIIQATDWPSGFTVGTDTEFNYSGETYASWLWKESVTSGFDIVTYTGTDASNRNVSHSLGVTPDFAIVKDRNNAMSWYAWHSSFSGATTFAIVDTDAATSTTSSPWGTGSWTSSTFRVTNDATNNTNALDITGTELLLQGDGADAATTFTDSSPVGRTMTANGNVQIDTAQSKFGGSSILFDGTGDYLSVADNGDFDFGTGNFTIDVWVRFTDSTGSHTILSGLDSGDLMFAKDTDGSLRWGRSLVAWDTITPDLTWTNGVWYHLAVTRSGNSVRIFRDGVLIDTETETQSYNVTTTFAVGQREGTHFFNGHMDQLRIDKGTARWTAAFTPSTVAYHDGSYVAYLFAAKEGFSDFGIYTGNGSADGPFVYTGFKPRFIMFKRTNSTANWRIMDSARSTYNPATHLLFPSVSTAETTTDSVDFLANGFKLRSTSTNINGGSNQYIYAAFADVPFKYSASTPAVEAGVNNGFIPFLIGMEI